MRVILSTLGPLHLLTAARFLSQRVDLSVVQGLVPAKQNSLLIRFLSFIVGRNLSKSFQKRMVSSLSVNISIPYPELLSNSILKLNLFKPKRAYWAALLYGRLSRKYLVNASILHVRSGSGMGGAIEAAKARRMRIVVDHSIAHPAFIDQSLRGEYEKRNKRFLMGVDNPFWQGVLSDCQKADILLVNSQFVFDTFADNGYPKEKMRIITQGVRSEFFNLKQDYSCCGAIRILFTGGFGFRKGAQYILEALDILRKRGVNFEFSVFGSVEKEFHVTADDIKFFGHVPQEELFQQLANSDVYLFPSLCEGCASSGLEAMAAGLPIVATKESGLPIVDGVNALIVTSKSSLEIANAIFRFCEDESLRRSLGTSAFHTVRDSCTWSVYADKVVDLYNKLLF